MARDNTVVREVIFGEALATVPRCAAHLMQTERTVGDGACAVHSMFGVPTRDGYAHWRPRAFIREAFGPTWDDFVVQLGDQRLLQGMESMLLLECIKPMAYDDLGLSMAGDRVGLEARLNWAAVRGHPDVFEACRNAASDEATK